MTIKQVIEHKEAILWFCTNPESGVWEKQLGFKWKLTTEPEFIADSNTIYVPNDSKSEYRMMEVGGEVLQEKRFAGWIDKRKDEPFWYSEYRIKPEHKEDLNSNQPKKKKKK